MREQYLSTQSLAEMGDTRHGNGREVAMPVKTKFQARDFSSFTIRRILGQ